MTGSQAESHGCTLRIIDGDSERQRLNVLHRRVLDDFSEAPLLPLDWERGQGFRSLTVGVYDGGELVGGLWASDPYTEFLLGIAPNDAPDIYKRAFITSFTTLHHVGFEPRYRGQGLGKALLAQLLAYAKRQRKLAIYGVTSPAAIGFYATSGYQVAAAEQPIYLTFGRDTLFFPIVGESVWFSRNTGGAFARGGASFEAPRRR